jgi:hypothetical protein
VIPGSNPQSKFQIIGSYTALPGSCSSCGKSDGPAVDTGLSFDFYGAVTFCQLCAQDIGRQAGLTDPVAEIKYSDPRYDLVVEVLKDVSGMVDRLGWRVNSVCAYTDLSLLEPSPKDEGSGTAEISIGESGSTESPVAGSAGQISDAAINKGPASVPSSAGNGKPGLKFDL